MTRLYSKLEALNSEPFLKTVRPEGIEPTTF
jgi:hypothetical protein